MSVFVFVVVAIPSKAHWYFQSEANLQFGCEDRNADVVEAVISAPPNPQFGRSDSLSQTILVAIILAVSFCITGLIITVLVVEAESPPVSVTV